MSYAPGFTLDDPDDDLDEEDEDPDEEGDSDDDDEEEDEEEIETWQVGGRLAPPLNYSHSLTSRNELLDWRQFPSSANAGNASAGASSWDPCRGRP
jgi:hypothetical protein